ncbi:hypothetical protein DICVIV_05515 [Dictyocaulus viviparus]|uniref:Uncharacterized protein n=1 Tax=Dictyocaulus viviparus TaxID=29172 RepID=A0A0D8XV56_DICVI|nr:hypothetical protein DICVIV_05515 [Dictyocaulus viviparus]
MAIFYGYFMSVILFNADHISLLMFIFMQITTFYNLRVFEFESALCEFDPTMLGQVKSKYFAFDIKNLKEGASHLFTVVLLLMHKTQSNTVLIPSPFPRPTTARANELLPYVSRVEKAVYEQCVSEAKSTVSLAKCAVRVFDSSNHMKKKTMLTKTKKSKSFITVIVHKKSSKHWMYIPQNFTVKRRTGSISHSAYGFKISNNSKVSPIKKQTRKQPKKWSMLESEKPMRRPSFSASLFPKKPFAAEREFVESLTNDSSRRTRRTKRESGTTNNGLSVNFRDVAMKYLQKMFGKSSNTSNLDNLRILHDHFKNTDKINNFFKQMNEENRRLYEKVALPIDSRTPEIANEAESAVEQILAIVNSFAANKTNTDKISVLSPRLLSLFPETSSVNRFLSPTFFSFQKSGYLSLPELFDIISSDQKYQQLMLDIVMDVSGAGTILEGLMTKLKPEMDKVKRVKLPLVDELSKNDQTWIKMHNSFSREQAEDYEEKGYAFMNEDQLNLIYTKRDQLVSGMNVTKLGLMSKQEKIKRLEEAIRQMAALGQPEWPIWDNELTELQKKKLGKSTATSTYRAFERSFHQTEEHRRLSH